jgi:uncharacterized protein YnzC (UPF0291/DUF896 family)
MMPSIFLEVNMENNIREQEAKYREYIDNHRANVQKAWDNMKTNSECMELIIRELNTSTDAAISLINELVEKHDLSKYEKEEFDAYRRYFYSVSNEEKESSKEDFDIAWKHHYEHNLHHWDYWYHTGKIDSMGIVFCVEEVCDWIAMGYQFNNTATEWYIKNSHDIHLGERQRLFTEELLNAFYK